MFRNCRNPITVLCLIMAMLADGGCQQVANLTKQTVMPANLRDIPAQRLAFRFEADVLALPELETSAQQPEKLSAIQADFDQHRTQEALERTISSPDKQRVLAIYQSVADEKGEFRLDIYEGGGKILRRITPENLALIFPDSVVWSPDGSNFAFAGSRRQNSPANQEIIQEAPRPPDVGNENSAVNANTPNPNADANSNSAPVNSPSPTSAPPTSVLTFRTEQIYLANREGGELKPLTQTEGLIYYYFTWSPDGTQLAALACKENEWRRLQMLAGQKGEVFKPFGRPRLLEKNGRERRLDDALTAVYPVWSPDSSKMATAFDKQVRIYDAIGNNPTAAALPLQVPLLIASKICDDKVAANQSCVNAVMSETNANNQANLPTTEPTTFVPIITLRWTEDKTLYLETGFIKEFTQGEAVRSYLRWHRLTFSPQAVILK
ncbi:MAG: hypothetical protein ABI954_00010 [Pyrinomonadaceae bacterium]